MDMDPKDDNLLPLKPTVPHSNKRLHIAEDTHDEVAHVLSEVVIQIEALDRLSPESNDSVKLLVNRIRSRVKYGLKRTRSTLEQLQRPADPVNFFEAIVQLITSIIHDSNLQVTLSLSIQPVYWDLKVQNTILLILYEVITNIHEHLSVSVVELSLYEQDEKLVIIVKDKCLKVDLYNTQIIHTIDFGKMYHLAASVDAELTIQSDAQQGSFIQLSRRLHQ